MPGRDLFPLTPSVGGPGVSHCLGLARPSLVLWGMSATSRRRLSSRMAGVLCAAVLVCATAVCATGLGPAPSAPEAQTSFGTLLGVRDGGVDAFLGVPYAEPPLPPRGRFAATVDWTRPYPHGGRRAQSMSPACPQHAAYVAAPQSEDCEWRLRCRRGVVRGGRWPGRVRVTRPPSLRRPVP